MKLLFSILFIFILSSCDSQSKQSDSCGYESFVTKHGESFSLLEPKTIEQAEKHSIDSLEAVGITGDRLIPFGRKNADWLTISNEKRASDCLIYFKTSKGSWKKLAGREGFMLLRDGEVLYTIVTRLS